MEKYVIMMMDICANIDVSILLILLKKNTEIDFKENIDMNKFQVSGWYSFDKPNHLKP